MNCKFCGSEKLLLETPYLNAFGEKITTPCCEAQKRNAEYLRRNYDPSNGRVPTLDEISDSKKL